MYMEGYWGLPKPCKSGETNETFIIHCGLGGPKSIYTLQVEPPLPVMEKTVVVWNIQDDFATPVIWGS